MKKKNGLKCLTTAFKNFRPDTLSGSTSSFNADVLNGSLNIEFFTRPNGEDQKTSHVEFSVDRKNLKQGLSSVLMILQDEFGLNASKAEKELSYQIQQAKIERKLGQSLSTLGL